MNKISGLLLVDKPKTWTSFDVVAKIRSIITRDLRQEHTLRGFCQEGDSNGVVTEEFNCRCKVKVGHSGTLDPMATGLLVLAIGKATKQLQSLTKLEKVYEAQLILGKTSSTDDQEGELTEVSKTQPRQKEIYSAISNFVGEIDQLPPIYSAIKIDGQRAYKMARAGKKPKMESRQVTIKSITELSYKYPKLSFNVDVSSGTYIRSLARDIGEHIKTGAYLSKLRRLNIGKFNITEASMIEELTDLKTILTHLTKV